MFFSTLLFFRIFAVHRDAPLRKLDFRMENGPAKGIYTTEASAAAYEEITNALLKYAPANGDLLVSSHLPFGYLITDLRPAAQSVWNSPYNDRLALWYERNPDRSQDVILTVASGIGFSHGDGNLPAALDAFSKNGLTFTKVYQSEICAIYLRKTD